MAEGQGRAPLIFEYRQRVFSALDLMVLIDAADTLHAAFVKHRTATHKVQPKVCETCQESDAAIKAYEAALLAVGAEGETRQGQEEG